MKVTLAQRVAAFTPPHLEYVSVTNTNMTDVAQWCGGTVSDGLVMIPSGLGRWVASVGQMVCHNLETGQFFVLSPQILYRIYAVTGNTEQPLPNSLHTRDCNFWDGCDCDCYLEIKPIR